MLLLGLLLLFSIGLFLVAFLCVCVCVCVCVVSYEYIDIPCFLSLYHNLTFWNNNNFVFLCSCLKCFQAFNWNIKDNSNFSSFFSFFYALVERNFDYWKLERENYEIKEFSKWKRIFRTLRIRSFIFCFNDIDNLFLEKKNMNWKRVNSQKSIKVVTSICNLNGLRESKELVSLN